MSRDLRRYCLLAGLAAIFFFPGLSRAGEEELIRFFRESLPDCPVITSAAADLNDDGREDMIIVYNIAPEVNRMRVVLDLPDGMVLTNEHPAPVENQVIQLRDIDDTPPMEFIIFGSRGLSTGFAIYRYHHGVLEDLFGEDMLECCN